MTCTAEINIQQKNVCLKPNFFSIASVHATKIDVLCFLSRGNHEVRMYSTNSKY
jgi:hypothetical protein